MVHQYIEFRHPWPIEPELLPAVELTEQTRTSFSFVYVQSVVRPFDLYSTPSNSNLIAHLKPGDELIFQLSAATDTLHYNYPAYNGKDAFERPDDVVIVSDRPFAVRHDKDVPRLWTFESRNGLTIQPWTLKYDGSIPVVLNIPALSNYGFDNERTATPWASIDSAQLTNSNIAAVGVMNVPTVVVSGVVTVSVPGVVTVAGTVTANQGAPNTTANAWPIKNTDGTNVAAVKAASTAPLATDPALVVSLSPNGQTVVVSGTVTVAGTVTANQGTANTVANAWPAKTTDGTNVAAVKPASTGPAASDPALVVSISPNGRTVAQGVPAVVANAWPIIVTDGNQIVAVLGSGTAAASSDNSFVVALSPNSPIPTGSNVVGKIRGMNSWNVVHAPVAATQATITQASGGSGKINVCTSITITLSSTAAPTAGSVAFVLRNGATGVGAIMWEAKLSLPAVAGECRSVSLSCWIEGAVATAMTLETTAAPPANVFATVAMTGVVV